MIFCFESQINNMKKVLYIGVASEHGGAARSMLEMVKTISKCNPDIEPIVLCCHKHGHIDQYRRSGILAYPTLHAAFCFAKEDSKIRFLLKYIPRYICYKIRNAYALHYIKSHIDMSKIDLIHSNSTRSDIGVILAKKYRIPHILHLREFGSKGTDYEVCYYRRNPLRYIDQSVTRYIAITNKVRDFWVDRNDFDSSKISVVYNGIDDSDIIKRDNCKFTEKLRMVFTGYIMETKGQRKLLEELALLSKETLERIQVDFIGSGDQSYVSALKRYGEHKGISEHIRFLGRRDNVHSLLQQYDIGLVCSRAEAFGRVTAEYMLAGLCVLASNTGANDELIQDGISGILFDYEQKGAIASKIEMLVRNREVLNRIAEQGYQRAKELFVTQINAKNVVCVYRNIWKEM